MPHQIVTYPGAPHGFFDAGFAEHAAACEDAWKRMLGFLSGL
ncbi:dienelactone hydrolase family protein [Nonomuraea sp. 10N515B]